MDITGSSDDVSVLSGAPITAAGSVSVSGGALSINQPLTGSDISLTATGNVTQDAAAALTANNLSLNGTGNFTLQNTSNDVNTIAGGTAGARLGAVKYFDADDVTIGTVNPTGIYSSDDVLIETATGNINLAEPVNTTSTTNTTTGDTGAIVLNAGKSAGTGSFGGGNIIVSGNGSVLSNGINKLYSESDAASTGLTTLAGGESNVRHLVDETTTTFNPVLAGDTTYVLYRSGPLGEGDLTIVASGGAAENSGWVYNNGVLATTQATVNVNASDLVTKLGLGNLTIEANNITVDASVSWNNANALTLEAIEKITVGADDELISAGGNISLLAGQSIGLSQSTSWDNRSVINANGGNIIIQAVSGAFDVSRVVSLAFVEIKTNGAGTIAITGDGTNSTRTSESSWGVSFDGVASQSRIQSEHGAINIVGVGGGVSSNSRGIVADGRDFQILSATGAIALRDQRPSTCASCGYGGLYLNPSTTDGTGIVFGSDGTTVLSGASTDSASTLTIQADRFSAVEGTSTIETTGAMTLEPASATFEASQTFPQALSLASDVSGLTLGKSGSTAGITVDAATTIAGPITLYGDDTSIEAALEATSDRVTFVGAAADDIKGTVSNNAAGTITADELLIENIHSVQLNTGNVNVAKLAGQGGHRMLLRNTGPLEIGSVGAASGLSASEFVVIETTTGDLTVTESVASTLSAGTSVTLNAGRDKGVGDDSGGDIVVSGNGVINIETDAIAKLYSGSPANSPGLSDKAGEVLVFYDETDQPPASAFSAGTVHAVYRQTTADRLRLDPEPSATAASGVALTQQPTVAIVDAFDNVIRTDDETQIAVSIFTGDNGTLQGATAQAVTEGQASYTDLGVLGPVGQAYRLRFTSPGLSAVTSDPVTLTAPGPLDLTASVLSADPVGNVTADGQSQSFLTATLTDTYGNPRANEAVVLALNETEGRTLGQTSGQTNAIGQFTTPLTSTVTGVTTVKAYSNSADPANEVDTVGVGFIADEPTQIELVSGDGQTGEVATALDNPLTVRVLDALDNVVEGASVTFTGDGSTDPVKGVVVTDGQGIASVDWTLGEQAGEQALQATLAGSDPEQSVTFQATATAGPPAQWAFEWETYKQLTTIPFDVTVVLQDAFANPTTAETDLTVAIGATNASADNSITGASDGDFTFDGTTNPVTGTLPAGETALALSEVVYSGLSAPDVETPDIELAATATLGGETLSGTGLISARDIQLVVSASPNEIVADGAEQSLITSTLLDLDDNPIANQPVRFENTLGELLDADSLEVLDQPVVLTGDANGQAQVVFRSQQASSAKVLTTSRGADPFELLISLVEDIDPAAVAALTAEDRPSDPDFGLEVYQDAGIEEATEDNLPAYNSALANLSLDADGVEAMVLAYNTLLSQAQTGSVALTEAQYAQLGITLSSREAVLLMNSILSAQGIDALKDHSRLLEIARIVQSLLDRRAGETEVTTIGADDLVLIGLQGVNSRNAGFIVGALSDPSTSSAALTLAQMQTLASEASEAFQALPIPTTHPWALWVLMGMLLGLGVSQTRRLRAHP
ncbi:MAG: Ig-like domain-containing protein [Wenzhouxiangella sp.]|nr:Ig-like domain-containing protein [Wenzhouxiangella sp.]